MEPKLNCVMLIDDSDENNFLNKRVIDKSDLAEQVLVFNEAKNALSYLETMAKYGARKPDIIFLDINMPVMNGWQFMEKYETLAANQKGDIVIMMLTTSLNPDDEEKAKQFKLINGFQRKPLTEKLILKVIKEHLGSIDFA